MTPLALFITEVMLKEFHVTNKRCIAVSKHRLSSIIQSAIAEHEKTNGPVMLADSSAQDAEGRAAHSDPLANSTPMDAWEKKAAAEAILSEFEPQYWMLKVGEVLQEGDEWVLNHGIGPFATELAGETVKLSVNGHYRRKITPGIAQHP